MTVLPAAHCYNLWDLAQTRSITKRRIKESFPLRSRAQNKLKHARNSDAAVFWIPAFAGMTSCPPFDFAQDRLRRASRVCSVWETRYGPCSGSERIMRSLRLILANPESPDQVLSPPYGSAQGRAATIFLF